MIDFFESVYCTELKNAIHFHQLRQNKILLKLVFFTKIKTLRF